jgi:hypothetical protein
MDVPPLAKSQRNGEENLISKDYEQEIYHTVFYLFVLVCDFRSRHTLFIQMSQVVMPDLAFFEGFKMSNVLCPVLLKIIVGLLTTCHTQYT